MLFARRKLAALLATGLFSQQPVDDTRANARGGKDATVRRWRYFWRTPRKACPTL
jgi:hypothetical protein